MKSISKIFTCLIVFSFLLASCKTVKVTPAPTIDTNAILTEVVKTAFAGMTATALITPTPEPSTTPTLVPTTVPETPTPPASPTPPATLTAPAPVGSLSDKALFVADVTIPDKTDIAPEASFTKTWRVKNVGTTTWTRSYTLVHISNDTIKSPASVDLPKKVASGEEVDISVDMTAPTTLGMHTSYWRLKNDAGQYFGVGTSGLDAIYVQINVVKGGGTPQPTGTVTPGGAIVSAVSLDIDQDSYTGSCPHTFGLTANFTLSKDVKVTYKLESHADTPGFVFNLPPAQTSKFSAGDQTLSFSLDFTTSGSGWIRFHITAPDDVLSAKVKFALTCQ